MVFIHSLRKCTLFFYMPGAIIDAKHKVMDRIANAKSYSDSYYKAVRKTLFKRSGSTPNIAKAVGDL